MTVIRTEGLLKTFRGPRGRTFAALDRVTASFASPGRITTLIGPDGSGKTTLMRLLAGILTADEGEIRILGRKPDTDDPAFVELLGFMPQKFGLYEELTVYENFELFGALRGVEGRELARRFEDLMALSGLKGFESRPAGKLSGGMKQKLGLSCSLIARPQVLLLDEPTVGVDPLSRRELWRMLRAMQEESPVSVFVSTAYLDEAAASDETLLLSGGKLIAQGTPASLTAPLGNRTFRASALDDRNEPKFARALMHEVSAEKPDSPLLDAVPRGDHAALLFSAGAAPKLSTILPARVEPRKPGLEDAYCSLTFPRTIHARPPARAPRMVVPEGEVVAAEHISRRFGAFTAVADTSFSVKKGEIFGLLGPNGAGKTTTFRMLCGLLAPSGGRIAVAGADLLRAKSEARRRVGYVAQKFSLYERLTARENLSYFGASYGVFGRELKNRIEELTADTELGGKLDVRTAELSLGAKRELAFACALVHRPAILFLDEATSGADVAARRAFWRKITDLAALGTTVIVTTHFMEEAEYCDRFLIQDAGRVLCLGTPAEVRTLANAASVEEAFRTIVLRAREGAGP